MLPCATVQVKLHFGEAMTVSVAIDFVYALELSSRHDYDYSA